MVMGRRCWDQIKASSLKGISDLRQQQALKTSCETKRYSQGGKCLKSGHIPSLGHLDPEWRLMGKGIWAKSAESVPFQLTVNLLIK